MQKVRRQELNSLRLLVSIQFQVLFHSPIRGSFHLSLAVLFSIGSKKYLGLENGLPIFRQDFTCLALLDQIFNIYL